MAKNPPTIASVADTPETAVAITERLKRVTREAFEPTVVGTFTHLMTGVESTIGSSGSFPTITSTLAASDLGAACASLELEVLANRKLVNRVVYILEANGMTS